MRINYLIILIFFGLLSLASAENTLVQTTFNLGSNQTTQTITPLTYFSTSIILEVDTTDSATCRYSIISNRDYGSMEETFDYNVETSHKKTISSLEEGLHKYYVKCMLINGTIPNTQLEISFKTEELISAQINFEKDSPLKAGQYGITLVTSKIPSQKPSLTYSIDGLTYNPVPLSGTEKVWKGYVVIPQSIGETVGSFKFSGKDLEGRTGETILKNAVFVIDTKKPSPIGTIDIRGYTGQIRLDWYNDEEVKEYQVFRSLEPQVDYTNYYKTTDDKFFIDNSVERGETYYYRVAPVDNAENIADLSREISATALLDNSTATTSGLRLELRSSVDNLLSSIDLLNTNINEIKNSFSEKEQKEKEIINSLQLTKEITDAQIELSSLKKDVESYKAQDLTKEDLDRKINSATLKIGVIKKKIPESITIQDEKSISRTLDESKINNLLLEYSGELAESEISKIVKNSLKIVKDRNVEITSKGYNIEISYMDGTRKQQTLVKEIINSELDRMQNTSIIVYVPSNIAESSTELFIKNTGYKVVKENLVLKFDSDTKEIMYSLNKKIDLKYLEDEIVSPIQIVEVTSNMITGNAIYSVSSLKTLPYNIIAPVVLVILLLFIAIKLSSMKSKVNTLFREIEKDIRDGKISEAKIKYQKIKDNYSSFNKKEKKIIYNKVLELQKKIGGS